MVDLSEGILFGLGNPLLDITANVDDDFLTKYGLLANNAILAEEKHKTLCPEMIEKYNVEYTAGGSVQNSMRVAQWFFNGVKNRATFMGAVGNDEFGTMMQNKAREDGVNVVYMIDPVVPTGTCACLLSGQSRSLCAYLGASQTFKVDHILSNNEWVLKANVFYASGFHLVVSPESILHLAKHAHSNEGKVFCMNLSAPYISQFYSDRLFDIFPYIDILFGNENEAAAFAKAKNWDTDNVKEIAKRMADEKSLREGGRLVIITQGGDNIIVAKTNDTQVKEFEPKKLDEKSIVDTNGAGDAFVGGFFSQYVQNEPLEVCIKAAIYAATEVIQLSGCTFPKENTFKK